MDETFIYHQIAENIRRRILEGEIKPGDRLPSVRDMMKTWKCTPGTVQRAYQMLSRQGLVVSRAGQGTHVTGSASLLQPQTPLRRANLVNRSEAFLLEALTAGYTLNEIQQSMSMAMDRWRSFALAAPPEEEHLLRFEGSHDAALTWLAAHAAEIFTGSHSTIGLSFIGSLGGLMALAEGKADLAGCHLWDEESDCYNGPFVRRLFPGRRMALVHLAERRIGLIVPPRNPDRVVGLLDLIRPEIRFVNRQPGSGTRVWLDAQLKRAGIFSKQIVGFNDERLTHTDVARAVAESKANVGLGLENAAIAYGLDFVFLTSEQYDLVIPAERMESQPFHELVDFLASPAARQALASLPGYLFSQTGQVEWVE